MKSFTLTVLFLKYQCFNFTNHLIGYAHKFRVGGLSKISDGSFLRRICIKMRTSNLCGRWLVGELQNRQQVNEERILQVPGVCLVCFSSRSGLLILE